MALKRDMETRYRQRYVDLIVTPKAREIFLKRSQIVREFRTSWKPTALWRK